ncbi:20146_t:CDS:10 [Cetraspora pellucida]|uniref:20146_t:CDS:1 n=1 Tax=Cetraspora pellucida TaxID=1433469 RepID=A0A9N9EFI4_9GLOM|nr:20146_t:CDS:10 [Cetraspora pellucida]
MKNKIKEELQDPKMTEDNVKHEFIQKEMKETNSNVNTKMTTTSKKRTNSSDESLEKDIKRKPIKARRNSRNESPVSLRERSPYLKDLHWYIDTFHTARRERRRKKGKLRGTKAQKVIAKNISEVFFDPKYWKIVDVKDKGWLFIEDFYPSIKLIINDIVTFDIPSFYSKGRNEIKNVVTLMVPGFDPGMFGMSAELAIKINRPIEISQLLERGLYGDQTQNVHEVLPMLSQVFSHACVTQAPGENGRLHSSFFSLMSCYIPEGMNSHPVNLIQQRILKCLLTHEQMRDNCYPIPSYIDKDSKSLPPGWIEISYPEYRPPSQEQYLDGSVELKILAIDCEMCITADGPALTRVSIVDDKLKEILRDVTVTIKDVQIQISELVDKHTVLVGHSLECDLKALRFAHPFIIDTSILYSDPRNSYKPKLKNLAKMWLDRNIQSKGSRGHDSIEDAMTCIDLLKMKLNLGLDFDKTHESIFERISRMTNSTTAVVDREAKTNLYVDGAKKVVTCKTDDEVLDALTGIISNDQKKLYNFVFGRFLDLKALPDDMYGRINLVKKLDERINKIYDKLPARTMFIITSGGGDSKEWLTLKSKRQEQFSDWTKHNEQELQNAYIKAKIGFSFFRLK